MPKDPLRDPWLKIRRAHEHVDEFERRYGEWLKPGLYDIVFENNSDGAEKIAKVRRTRPFPEELSCVIADVFHNLRSALDQIAYILATRVVGCVDEGALRHCYFPVARNDTAFKDRLTEGKNAGFFDCDLVLHFFREFEPYPRGKDKALFAIHELDRADRHRFIVNMDASDIVRVVLPGERRAIYFPPGGPDEIEIERLPASAPEPEYHPHFIAGVEISEVYGIPAQPLNTIGNYRRAVRAVFDRAETLFFPYWRS